MCRTAGDFESRPSTFAAIHGDRRPKSLTVEENIALGWGVDAGEKVEDGGLARAVRPNSPLTWPG